eukprot:jgi/Astpho2/4240/fgenesh1_pg.00064_%23_48_t
MGAGSSFLAGIACSVALATPGAQAAAAATDLALPSWQERFAEIYTWQSIWLELVAAVAIVLYAVNIYLGRNQNEAIVLDWAKTCCSEGGILERNFSVLGPEENSGPEIILKDSMRDYKLHASGRRNCLGLLAELDLLPRQDLFQRLYYQFKSDHDHLNIEVYLSDAQMEPLVLGITANRPGLMKTMKSLPDIKAFTRRQEVGRDRLPQWPSDQLSIQAEQAQIFYDLMPDQVQDILFSQKGWQALGKYFRFLHFTSEQPEGLHRHVLRFGFNLPRLGHMEELDPLLTMVMLFIDAVGQHKLSPDQRKKGEERRQELEKQTTKVGNGQESRLEELRMKKAEEEKERLMRMTPAQREKYKERKDKIQQKRMMKARTIKG